MTDRDRVAASFNGLSLLAAPRSTLHSPVRPFSPTQQCLFALHPAPARKEPAGHEAREKKTPASEADMQAAPSCMTSSPALGSGPPRHGIDPARLPETAFPYARGVARRGVALVYVACWGCKAHLDGPTQAGLQGCLVSSVRCPQGVTAMDTRNGAFEIFDFSVYVFPLHVESTRVSACSD